MLAEGPFVHHVRTYFHPMRNFAESTDTDVENVVTVLKSELLNMLIGISKRDQVVFQLKHFSKLANSCEFK